MQSCVVVSNFLLLFVTQNCVFLDKIIIVNVPLSFDESFLSVLEESGKKGVLFVGVWGDLGLLSRGLLVDDFGSRLDCVLATFLEGLLLSVALRVFGEGDE